MATACVNARSFRALTLPLGKRARTLLGRTPQVSLPSITPAIAHYHSSNLERRGSCAPLESAGVQALSESLGNSIAFASIEGAAALLGPVHVLHMALPRMLHQQSRAVGALRREQQMHVVGHEAIGVHRAFERGSQLAHMRKVARLVIAGNEAGAAVVAALDDVDRHLGHGDAGMTRHPRASRAKLS